MFVSKKGTLVLTFNISFEFSQNMDERVVIAILLLDEEEKEEKCKLVKKQCWIRPWLQKRNVFGDYHTIFQEIITDNQSCRRFIRMGNIQYNYLVETYFCSA